MIEERVEPVVTITCPVCKGTGKDEYKSPSGGETTIIDTCMRCGGDGAVVRYVNVVKNEITYKRI